MKQKMGNEHTRMKNKSKNFFFLVLALASTLPFFLAGCLGPSMNVRVTVTPTLIEKTYPDKMPVNIGLYVSEEFRNYRYTDSTKTLGTTYDFWNVGSESSGMFETGLSQVFQKVVVVDQKPPFPKAPPVPLRVVVEPKIEGLDFKVPAIVVQKWSARIQYQIVVYNLEGKVIWQKAITGIGEVPGSYTRTTEELGNNPAKPATAAIIDATDKMIEAILASEEIKALAK
jgi:hypothetical protein